MLHMKNSVRQGKQFPSWMWTESKHGKQSEIARCQTAVVTWWLRRARRMCTEDRMTNYSEVDTHGWVCGDARVAQPIKYDENSTVISISPSDNCLYQAAYWEALPTLADWEFPRLDGFIPDVGSYTSGVPRSPQAAMDWTGSPTLWSDSSSETRGNRNAREGEEEEARRAKAERNRTRGFDPETPGVMVVQPKGPRNPKGGRRLVDRPRFSSWKKQLVEGFIQLLHIMN